MDIIKTPISLKYRVSKDYVYYVPFWVAEELETSNEALKAENAALRADVELYKALLKQRDAENAETLLEAVKIEDERNTLLRENAALRAAPKETNP